MIKYILLFYSFQIVLVCITAIVGISNKVIIDRFNVYIPFVGIFYCVKYICTIFYFKKSDIKNKVFNINVDIMKKKLDKVYKKFIQCDREYQMSLPKKFEDSQTDIKEIVNDLSKMISYVPSSYKQIESIEGKIKCILIQCIYIYNQYDNYSCIQSMFMNMLDVLEPICDSDIEFTQNIYTEVLNVIIEYYETLNEIIFKENERDQQKKCESKKKQEDMLVPKLKSIQDQLKLIKQNYK